MKTAHINNELSLKSSGNNGTSLSIQLKSVENWPPNVPLRVSFFGHYKEPDITLEVNLRKDSSQLFDCSYNPSVGTWTMA